MLRKTFISYIFFVSCLMFFSSCKDDIYDLLGFGEEQPVDFIFNISGDTRGINNPKTSFNKKDLVHIQGVFKLKDGSEITRYGAMEFDGNEWVPVANSQLTWPNTAISGKFQAYFISGTTGIITSGSSATTLLSNTTPQTDPLHADWTEEESYGYSINLNFKHICTYLSLLSVQTVASRYFLVKTKNGVTDPDFHNAYRLLVNEQNELSFEFLTVADNSYENPDSPGTMGMVYIAGSNSVYNGKSQVNFFLEPGLYDEISIRYPTSNDKTIKYLEYNYNEIINADEEDYPDLQAGNTYTLDIAKAEGLTIISPPEEQEEWNETEPPYDIDVEAFLRAVTAGDNYFWESGSERIQILQKTATGVKLLHNVDFKNTYYSDFNGFIPTINGTDQTFDGGFNYIHNVGCTMFLTNNGTIKNLGIKYASQAKFISQEDNIVADMSRQGLLVGRNLDTGKIMNIRVKGPVNITAEIINDEDPETAAQEAHNIGTLIGSNIGTVSDINVAGDFQLTVKGRNNQTVNASVLIGGIAGQNTGNGSISEVNVLEDDTFSLTIYNNCKGNGGAFYVGGLVGNSSATLHGIMLSSINVDSSNSEGVVSYVGGMVGQLGATSGTPAKLNSCIIDGSLKAGKVAPYGDVSCESYAGGIAGVVLMTESADCRAAIGVTGTTASVNGAEYATGGAFGRLRSNVTMSNIMAYGSTLTGLSSAAGNWTGYIGNFAGISTRAQTWENYFANQNLTIRRFGSFNYIGISF